MATPSRWPELALLWLRDNLTVYLIDDVDGADDTQAGTVILGTLQDDPVATRIWVEVYENDPDEKGWEHALVTTNRDDDNPKYRDVIGRTRSVWLRRFLLKINIFLEGQDREAAGDVRAAVMHRMEQLLLDYPNLDALTDDGGERAIIGRIVRESGLEGGTRSQDIHIWRAKVWMEFKTIRRR